MFINDLNGGIEWIEYTLCEFMEDIKLGGETDTLDSRAAVWKNLNKLEKCAEKNLWNSAKVITKSVPEKVFVILVDK